MSDGIMARVVGGWSEGRLEKAGVKGQSQQLPEAVWAEEYASGQVVEPPYDLEALAGLYEGNSTHKACVDAKTTNIVGLGYRFVNTAAYPLRPKTVASSSLRSQGDLDREGENGNGGAGDGERRPTPSPSLQGGEKGNGALTPSPSPMRPQTVEGRGVSGTAEKADRMSADPGRKRRDGAGRSPSPTEEGLAETVGDAGRAVEVVVRRGEPQGLSGSYVRPVTGARLWEGVL